MVMAIVLSLCPHPPKPHENPSNGPNLNPSIPIPTSVSTSKPNSLLNSSSSSSFSSKRRFLFNTASLCILSLTLQYPIPISSAVSSPSPLKSILSEIANTKSWFQFEGNGFAIRVPPQFEDVMEPEDYNSGLSLYGDKAKPKTFAARFASSDGSEVLSVVIRPTNQLKITFLEAKDIADLGTLKEAAKIFIPGGSIVFSARTIKIKEDDGFRTYYYYEFGRNEQHVAMVAAVSSGKAIIAGAAAPQSKWDDDGVKLRSAAVSLTVL